MAKKLRQKRRTKTDNLTKKQQELERLGLEIKEREWSVSLLGKLVKLAPLFTPFMLAISILASVYWYTKQWNLQIEQQRLEAKRQRQETITSLKREFASENPAIRIAACKALADYPKEAIPVLIASLRTDESSTKEEDVAFTEAVKTSLRQIGEDAIIPLTVELRRLKKEIKSVLLEAKIYLGFCLDTVLYKPLENVREKLRTSQPMVTEEKIDSLIAQLHNIRTSKPQLKVAHKNTVEVLADLLRQHHIEGLRLPSIDLSGTNLASAYLSGADLRFANLAGAILDSADLSNADLKGADLCDTQLMGANLTGVDLSLANLSGASFGSSVIIYAKERYELKKSPFAVSADFPFGDTVKGFRDARGFHGAILRGVKGLSKEDLEYAKSKGAIIE